MKSTVLCGKPAWRFFFVAFAACLAACAWGESATAIPSEAHVWFGTIDSDFNTAGNWKIGQDAATLPPDKDTMVAFTNISGKVTFSGDAAVSNVWVSNGSPVFDLQGRSLNVQRCIYLCTVLSFKYPTVTFTNGVVNSGSNFQVNYGPADTAWFYGKAVVSGPGTELNVGGATYLQGRGTSITVQNGALFSSAGIVDVSSKAEGTTFGIRDNGSTANFTHGFSIGGNNAVLKISDGAVLNVSGICYTSYGNRNSIGRDGAKNGLVVDNATVNYGVASTANLNIGDTDNATITGDNALIVTNNGAFNMLTANDIRCGVSIGQNAQIKGGRIVATDGGKIASNGSIQLGVGANNPCGGHLLAADDGTITATYLQTGNKALSSNSLVRISGKRGKILLTHSTSPCQLNSAATLEFRIPEDGFDAVPLQAPNGAVTKPIDGTLAPIKLTINAQAFGKKNPSRSITLVAAGADSTTAFTVLTNNLSFIDTDDRFHGKLIFVDGGKKLVYTSPARPGLTVSLR